VASREWFRALQLPVIPVSVGPAVVGSLAGAQSAGALDAPVFVLVTASLALIQIAANLQKGLVESADLPTEPRRPSSPFAFDAGAVLRVGVSRAALTRVMGGAFAAGALMGLLVVVLRRDPLLLLLGGAGAFLAYAYSGTPFKLSYRGVGEAATFATFGPLMLTGAAYAQHPSVSPAALWLGVAFGFFAAAISFARYFPAEDDDRARGKRTPVVRFGRARAAWGLAALFLGGAVALATGGAALAASAFVPSLVVAAALVTAGAFGNLAVRGLRSNDPARIERGVAATVINHLVISACISALLAAFLAGAL
jgi:1,4-dihydroxy-2-naphthoate octaprenyltransferase